MNRTVEAVKEPSKSIGGPTPTAFGSQARYRPSLPHRYLSVRVSRSS